MVSVTVISGNSRPIHINFRRVIFTDNPSEFSTNLHDILQKQFSRPLALKTFTIKTV